MPLLFFAVFELHALWFAEIEKLFSIFTDRIIDYIVPVDLRKASPCFIFAGICVIIVVSAVKCDILYDPFIIFFEKKENDIYAFAGVLNFFIFACAFIIFMWSTVECNPK